MGVNIRISAECLRRGQTVYDPCRRLNFASPIPLLSTIAMFLHRRSTEPTLNRSPSLPTNSPLIARRSLNLVTHQQPFRASTSQTAEAETFVSETTPQDILPLPSWPVSPLRSPFGNSGPRRQLSGYDTQETLRSSPFEERVSPEPPNVIPTSPVSQTSEPHASPTRPRRPAPGGGAGRSALTLKSSTRSGPSPPPYETAGTSEGMHAAFWPTYNKASREFDEKRLGKWDRDLDILLVFVSLVVTVVNDH